MNTPNSRPNLPLHLYYNSPSLQNTRRRRDENISCQFSNLLLCLQTRGGSSSDASRSVWSFGSKPVYPQQNQSNTNNNNNNNYLNRRSNMLYPTVEDVTEEDENSQLNSQDAKEMMETFLSRDNRNSFITRVYAILTTQLLVTAGTILYMATHREVPYWMMTQGRMIVPFLSMIVSMGSMLVMTVSVTARQSSPLKWQLLSLFTVGESILLGFISSFYPLKTILSAFLSTAAATGSVTMYTLLQRNPKYDLSQTGRTLASVSLIFVLYGLVYLIFPNLLPYSEMLYSIFGACLFSWYLSFHTRLIVSGEHSKYRMSSKDYVYGAMTLYADIINLFLYILRILGNAENGD